MARKTILSHGFCETHVDCRITKFLDLPSNDYYVLESEDFFTSDAKWYLQIFPNKLKNGTQYIGLFLGRRKCIKCLEHRISFKLSIKDTDGSVLKAMEAEHIFTVEEETWGWFQFVERDALKPKDILAPDGSLTVFCTLLTVDNMKAISQTTHTDDIPNLSKDLKDLYLSKRFTDVTIKVKSKEFSAHISILAARSAVFASMFQHDTEEKKCGRVEIPDCEPDTFEYFLLFLYTGNLDVVTSINAVNLYLISDKYDVQELKEKCVQRMSDTLTVDSFCDVLHLAVMHNESELLKTTSEFFINNARQIMLSQKWHAFISENPLLCNELLLKSFTK